jgi:hypothetical protein
MFFNNQGKYMSVSCFKQLVLQMEKLEYFIDNVVMELGPPEHPKVEISSLKNARGFTESACECLQQIKDIVPKCFQNDNACARAINSMERHKTIIESLKQELSRTPANAAKIQALRSRFLDMTDSIRVARWGVLQCDWPSAPEQRT